MNKISLLTLSFIVLLAPIVSRAQFQGQLFHFNPDAKVIAWSNEKSMAWVGGANNPQFSLADLNNDQRPDLVMYEPYIGVKTFLNQGTAGNPKYVYTPIFEHNFPYIQGYLKLLDYNSDMIPDLFQRGGAGFAVYKGYYENGQLKFTFYRDLFYSSVSGWVNAYCEPNDIPGIEDIDHDGDVDFLSFYIGGGKISWYRNCRVEDGLPPDSIRICLKDNCWGKTFQSVSRTHMLHTTCDSWGTSCKGCENDGYGNKTTHTGNALCLLDYDGDGDFDYFDGNVSYPDVQLLLNGKNDFSFSIDSMLWQDTMWNTNGHKLNMPVWPGGYWLDIDQDGDRDLLFSPTAAGTENYKCIAHYKNTGSDANPIFTYQSDSFLVDRMIDVGTGSYPFFYDYNKDGKTDLFIGSDGYYQPDGTLRGMVSYYKNTSTSAGISFELQTTNFMQLSNFLFKGTSIAIGDIDNDGKDDLVLGHTSGTLSYFKNMAASATDQPVWTLAQIDMKDQANQNIAVTNYAAPVIYDMDKDGKKDLVIGNSTGYLSYYKSNSAGGSLSLTLVTHKLGNAKADPNAQNIYTMSTPYIGKMDNTGVDYLVMGSQDGRIFRFDGFQNGNVTTDYTMIDTNYSFIKAGMRTAPAFADLDGDNKYEMVVGNVLGGVSFYKQLFNVDVDALSRSNMAVTIYPNPASDILTVDWELPAAIVGDVQVHIISALGQRMVNITVPASQNRLQVPVGALASGMYYCIVQSGNERAVQPVTIAR